MRKSLALALASLTLVSAVFVGAAPSASADSLDDAYEQHIRDVEAAQGITREECRKDWLGLHIQRCAHVQMAQAIDTDYMRQMGYTSEQALAKSKELSESFGGVKLGLAPSPAQVAGAGVSSGSTVVSGVTAGQAGMIMTGAAAYTGWTLASTVGLPESIIGVDAETTDLVVLPGGVPGWANGSNSLMSGPVQLTFDIVDSEAHWGTVGAFRVRVTHDDVEILNQGSASGVYARIQDYWGSEPVRLFATGGINGCFQNLTNFSTWWNGGDPRLSAVCTFTGGEALDTVRVTVGASNDLALEWFPQGHQYRPVEEPSGMVGTLTTTLECTSSEGSQEIVFTETYTGGFEINVAGKECPAGHVLTGGLAEWTTGEGTQTVWEYDAPDEIKNIPVEFDHCLTGADCGLGLWRILSNGEVESCGALAIGCQNWWGSANKTDVYQCRAGGSVVDLGYCAMFREPGTISPVRGVDVTENGEVVIQERIVSLNPEDFEHLIPVPFQPIVPVQPDPGAPEPTPPLPPPPPAPVPDVDVIRENAECFPDGWGVFNPFEWVYRPVRCALSWAFIPQKQLDFDGIKTALTGTAIGGIGGIVFQFGTAFGNLTSHNDCGVLAQTTLSQSPDTEVVITTCNPIIEQLRPFTIIGLAVIAYVGALIFSLNAILTAFGLAGLFSQATQDEGSKGDSK